MTDEELPVLSREYDKIMYGLTRGKMGGLICTDKEAMDNQKGILVEVLRQLTMNLLKGLTISHISLPVKMFEPRSSIQRVVDLFSHAPQFFNKAAKIDDHLERFKLVIAGAMSSIYICCTQMKPFNPLLGETL